MPARDALTPLRDAVGRRVYAIVERVVAARMPALVDAEVQRALAERLPAVRAEVAAHVAERSLREHRVWGPPGRLEIAPTAHVNDALFNTVSGTITVEAHAFFGHGVSVLTGTHDITKEGAWIASNATILGPCVIGEHAVVAAGAVVTGDVPARTIYAGVPAKRVGTV